jgi:predicted small lipoprotein YifL
MNRKRRSRMLKMLTALALGLSIAGCALAGPPYPNVVPIDKTGNFGAR